MSVPRRQSTSSLSRYARASEIADTETRNLDFCNAFWGVNDDGVEVLFARMRRAAKTIEDMKSFWRERATIEEEYAKRLIKLAKQTLGKDEVGELKNSLEIMRVETERQAGQHLTLSISIRKDLEGPTNEFAVKQANHRKTFQSSIEKTWKNKQQQETYVARAKERYEQDCHRVNSYTAQQTLVQGRELEKINAKLGRVTSTVDQNQRDYQNYTKVLAETVGRWDKEWKIFCDQCQDLEEERLEFMKDNLWAYANHVSTVCVAEDDSCEKIRLALEQLEVEKDIEFFVSQYGTGSQIPETPPFINYTSADASSQKPSVRRANFARSSTRPMMPPPGSSAPEEEPTDAGAAGIGAIGAMNPPTHSRQSSRSRQGTINGQQSPPIHAPTTSYGGNQYGAGPSSISSHHQAAGSIGGSSMSQYPPGPSSQPYSRAPYQNTPDTGYKMEDPHVLGGAGDPIAAEMERLKNSGDPNRRGTVRNAAQTHKTPSSKGSINRPVSPSLIPNAASPKAGTPINYQEAAGSVVGEHPHSRPPSPAVPVMAPETIRSTSPVPVEAIIASYGQSLPGEPRPARRNSIEPPRGRTTERNMAQPSSPGGYAGVGARRSPSPIPYNQNRAPSPSRPMLQQPVPAPVRSTSPSVGIALDNNGNVAHDQMAEEYARRVAASNPKPPYSTSAPSVPNQVPAPAPSQMVMPGHQPYPGMGANRPMGSAYYTPPAPPPTGQPPPPPSHAYAATGTAQQQYHQQMANAASASQALYTNQLPGAPGSIGPTPVGGQAPMAYGQPNHTNGYSSVNSRQGHGHTHSHSDSMSRISGQNGPYQTHPTPAVSAYHNPSVQPQPPLAAQPPPSPQPPMGQNSSPTGAIVDGMPVLFYVKALYDYQATIDEEFDFQAGDVIAVTATPEDGWWSGILLDDTRRRPGKNVFPSNFVCLF